eukprot:CAMPEP_0198670368 /NCGR_PEP_ID=MMETSP1467-20131203/80619_1 /TAXON_ID=1462469 /ORGANISM="unid. sp., Strain CCMP2135" /LENGTH=41 /DNA_ID= /DNA_START= /DNA_END= /DNA_ORIENTATION=
MIAARSALPLSDKNRLKRMQRMLYRDFYLWHRDAESFSAAT